MNSDIDLQSVKLVATDLDGTLLRSDGTLSSRSIRALTRLTNSGTPVVFVTARPPRFVKQLIESTSLESIHALCCNGALTCDLGFDIISRHLCLEGHNVRRLSAAIRTLVPGTCFAVEMGFNYGWEAGYAEMDGALVEAGGIESDIEMLCQGPVTKLIARHPELNAAELLPFAREAAGSSAEVTHSGNEFVEISAKGVDKASALEHLSASLGVSSSGVMAFGDMPNDITLLKWAGIPVAMANAHSEVLAVTTCITLSNDEDGVATVLEQLPLGGACCSNTGRTRV